MAKKQDEYESYESEEWSAEDNEWYQKAKEAAKALDERSPFSYDPGADPLYNSAKAQYVRLGKRAMEDTMGQAAGLSGGYASSYAQTQASQAYDDQLTRLASLLPDYYERARAAYDRETADLRDELGTAIGLYDKDYQVWLDRQSARERQAEAERRAEQWEREFERDQDHWEQEFSEDHDRWTTSLDQWERRFAEDHDRWAAEFARETEQWAAQQAANAEHQSQSERASARSYAYRMAMLALQQGLDVSDALLETAGIDRAYAETIRQYYANRP